MWIQKVTSVNSTAVIWHGRHQDIQRQNLTKSVTSFFRDIDKDTVDFVDNYDNTMKEPSLLPVAFPSVLVNTNTGIAVGMASNICSFNLKEICETTAALIRDPNHDVMQTLPAPDFIGGLSELFMTKTP